MSTTMPTAAYAATLPTTPMSAAPGALSLSIKRALDIALAATGLLLAAPLLLSIAALIRLESPGPVLFRQQRGGLHGHPFTLYKFRTMTVGTEHPLQQTARRDPRLTRLGGGLRRLSLDELPQLWNILRGEMSLVGPRPHMLTHDAHYRRFVPAYDLRFRMRPGLTGLAQSEGLRGETDRLEKMALRIAHDNRYIEEFSLGLDIKILLRTVRIVLLQTNAY